MNKDMGSAIIRMALFGLTLGIWMLASYDPGPWPPSSPWVYVAWGFLAGLITNAAFDLWNYWRHP